MNTLGRILSLMAGLAAAITLLVGLFSRELLDQYTLMAIPDMPLLAVTVGVAVLPFVAAVATRKSGLTRIATGIALVIALALGVITWQEPSVMVVVAAALNAGWGWGCVAADMTEAADELVEPNYAPAKRR